jgi:hypothetical protein
MPMANIMAVVAVLEIHAEMKAVTAPKATSIRPGRAPTHLIESTPKARRRSRRCRKIARAMMNDPMKRNINGSANGANTSRAGATRIATHAAAPASAVTGSGSASVIHRMTTAAITAASRCASGFSAGSGRSSNRIKTEGASTNPATRRTRSKRASPSVISSTTLRVPAIVDFVSVRSGAELISKSMTCGQTFPAARRV